ncbi:thermonuclease family protein [Leptolyngbya sp. FACHB-541]|uniref:thermonuclease family protein n=1 Tax=Leptolyngbya sp. FACHB-541 TaxID=2692810 RepID=UPI00168908FD|nr:thermonuclease family protein [Leptolyngbya sp. FACHB-541]MBD1997687.1 thermonuclease family protein [Leptolyngbya sp. FACHB-541]
MAEDPNPNPPAPERLIKQGQIKKYSFLIAIIPILGVVGVVAYQQRQNALDRQPNYDYPFISGQNAALAQGPGNSQLAQVIEVQSGDVLRIQKGWRSETLRLCGIDAPELEQPFGTESKQYLEQLINRVNGQIIFVPHGKDRQGRTIAEVFISAQNAASPEEELFINAEMVASSLAYTYPDFVEDCYNGDTIAQVEGQVRQQQEGVWSDPAALLPWVWRQQHSK